MRIVITGDMSTMEKCDNDWSIIICDVHSPPPPSRGEEHAPLHFQCQWQWQRLIKWWRRYLASWLVNVIDGKVVSDRLVCVPLVVIVDEGRVQKLWDWSLGAHSSRLWMANWAKMRCAHVVPKNWMARKATRGKEQHLRLRIRTSWTWEERHQMQKIVAIGGNVLFLHEKLYGGLSFLSTRRRTWANPMQYTAYCLSSCGTF